MSERWKTEKGFIYLLHFHTPYRHACHYTGWALDVDRRTAVHMDGLANSSRLVKVALAAGIGFDVARIWEGKTREDEAKMKAQGGASRRCPICKEQKNL